MRRAPTALHGAVDVATAACHGGLATIEGMHTAIARKPFVPMQWMPVVGDVSAIVQEVHDGITRLVYGGIRSAIMIASSAARVAANLGERPAAGLFTRPTAERAVAALNGIMGEHLAGAGNPLATQMALRQDGKDVVLERPALAAAFPAASPRLAVFVHGLASDETVWQFHAARHYGNRHTTYGTRLQADLGFSPLYVRYNSGLHISQNGRQLAHVLDRLVAEWPTPAAELTLIGHSMGGLVIRSACHYAQTQQLEWAARVRHAVFLGSPHLGAPLEKGANIAAWLLGLSDVTRPVAAALNVRSAGIKDLRFGSLLDEDWRETDPDALLTNRAGSVPLLAGAAHYFVAATITRDAHHPLGVVVGDLLVRAASASGRGRLRHLQFPLENTRHYGAMSHLELLNHPALYTQLRDWLTPA